MTGLEFCFPRSKLVWERPIVCSFVLISGSTPGTSLTSWGHLDECAVALTPAIAPIPDLGKSSGTGQGMCLQGSGTCEHGPSCGKAQCQNHAGELIGRRGPAHTIRDAVASSPCCWASCHLQWCRTSESSWPLWRKVCFALAPATLARMRWEMMMLAESWALRGVASRRAWFRRRLTHRTW
jgi:hypothetical protein